MWLLSGLDFLFLLLFNILFRPQWLAAAVLWLLILTVEMLAFAQPFARILAISCVSNTTLTAISQSL
jgi:hypothetical protein